MGSGSFQSDCQGFVFGGGGPCTALSPGLKGGGLESQFGRGPRHPRQESDGLVLLVPRLKRGMCFRGTQLGALIRESLGNLIAYHLLESSTGAYIEWLVNELMMTANEIEYKDARLVMLPTDAIKSQAR